MCLYTLYDFDVADEGFGWKVVQPSLRNADNWNGCINGKNNPFDSEIERSDGWFRLHCEEFGSKSLYPVGFHVFLTEADAKAYGWFSSEIIVRVRYRKILAKGLQRVYVSGGSLAKCIVTQFISLAKDDFLAGLRV